MDIIASIIKKIVHLKEKKPENIINIIGGDITYHSGATSTSFSNSHIFVKYITNVYEKNNVYEREKYISSILNKFDWYPPLLYYNDIYHILIFKNVGIPITLKNKPNNLQTQFDKILFDMKSVNVQHNDIKIGEILIDSNKKIYLCDFGWGSVNNRLDCNIGIWNCNSKDKPGGYRDDEKTLERLGLI